MMSWNLQWGGFKEDQEVQMSRLPIRGHIRTPLDQEVNQDGEAGILRCLVLHQRVNHHIDPTLHLRCSLSLPIRLHQCR